MAEVALVTVLVVFVGVFVVWPAWRDLRQQPCESSKPPRCTVRRPRPCSRCKVMVENPVPMALVLRHKYSDMIAVGPTVVCQACIELYWQNREAFATKPSETTEDEQC